MISAYVGLEPQPLGGVTLVSGSEPYSREVATQLHCSRWSHRTEGSRALGTSQVKVANLGTFPLGTSCGTASKSREEDQVRVLLATVGAWHFWMLMSTGCECCQSFECAIHSFTFISASLEAEMTQASWGQVMKSSSLCQVFGWILWKGHNMVIRSGLCFRKGPWQPVQRMDVSVDRPQAGRSLGKGEGRSE